MNIYTTIDLNLNKLLKARLDPLLFDPPFEELRAGRLWFNESEKQFKYFDGEIIRTFSGNIENLENRVAILEQSQLDMIVATGVYDTNKNLIGLINDKGQPIVPDINIIYLVNPPGASLDGSSYDAYIWHDLEFKRFGNSGEAVDNVIETISVNKIIQPIVNKNVDLTIQTAAVKTEENKGILTFLT